MGQVFSTEVPELFPSHLEHLLASGISIDVIRARGYKSLLGKKALDDLGFSSPQQRTPGLLIPLHAPDGAPAGHQYRPDNPRLNNKQKSIKYEGVPGSSLRLDMPPTCQAQARDPQVDIYITEGAKKADALASRGVCAVNLSGVWGFKGRNEFGSSVFNADFDLIAWNGRNAFICFDSDIMTKPMVKLALDRLKAHLERLGARVFIVQLPDGPDGAKTGVDDYLAAGHTVDNLRELVATSPEVVEEPMALHNTQYCVHEGCFCLIKALRDVGKVMVPLCNFTAQISDEIIFDDGFSPRRDFVIQGALPHKSLPDVEIPATSFSSMDWVPKYWGRDAVINAGTAVKDHLRAMMQLSSRSNGNARRIFTHTGWRVIDSDRFFLTNSGGLGKEGVEVSLGGPLARYSLPEQPELVDSQEAVRESLRFLDIANFEVTAPLWGAMYLAPLCELLEPAFTLWLAGHTGSFKSVLSALALCHFGDFNHLNLPTSWRDTANRLEWAMSMLKDLPMVIDDWHPAPTIAGMREMEAKAEIVIRAQGNRAGRGRLRADASPRDTYTPRGFVISTGEQLPCGESGASRLFVVDIERHHVNMQRLTEAQANQHIYRHAMGHYILWLRKNWDDIGDYLRTKWPEWRSKATAQSAHLRLPAAVAWLYAGVDLGMTFALEQEAIDGPQAQELGDRAWECFIDMASQQGRRVEEERPGKRFVDALATLLAQQRVVVISRHSVEPWPGQLNQSQTFIGWCDDTSYYLLPQAAYGAIFEFCQKSGSPLTIKANAVWADLARLGLLSKADRYNQLVIWIGTGDDGRSKRVIAVKRAVIDGREGVQDEYEL